MKLHELQPAAGSVTAPKRLGRGVGSGLGKTSGKEMCIRDRYRAIAFLLYRFTVVERWT